jgi:hypothetical protein
VKAFRRTGDRNDQVRADTGRFSDHAAKLLAGTANNFKPGKTIPLGSVQYIQPTSSFPEIRLRYTPAAGTVYGPDANDANIVDDVYDGARGRWKGNSDEDPNVPESTVPGFIYARDYQNRSFGYLDDSCDGIIVVNMIVRGRTLSASARFSSGPPDFAPDAFPVRSLADELEQMLLGPEVAAAVAPDEVFDIVRHALQTVQILNTEAMNRGGMAAHNRGLERAAEPIFQPGSRASNPLVRAFHANVLKDLEGLTVPAGSPARVAAVAALRRIASLLRDFDKDAEWHKAEWMASAPWVEAGERCRPNQKVPQSGPSRLWANASGSERFQLCRPGTHEWLGP